MTRAQKIIWFATIGIIIAIDVVWAFWLIEMEWSWYHCHHIFGSFHDCGEFGNEWGKRQ